MAAEHDDDDMFMGDGERINPEDIVEVYEIDGDELAAGMDDMDDDDPEGGAAEGEGEGEGEEGGDEDEEDGTEVVADRTVIERGDNSAARYLGHQGAVFCVAMDPTDTLAVTGGEDDSAQLWKIATGEKVLDSRDFKDSVTAVAFNFDGAFLATASLDGVIVVWACATSTVACRFECGDDLMFIDWHPSANFLIAGTGSGCVHMWDVPRGNMTFFNPHTVPLTCGKWMPDGRTFVTGAQDGTFVQCSPKTQQAILKLDDKTHQFHTSPITCVATHPDSIRVCVGAQDGSMRVLQIKTGKVIATFDGHTDSVEMVAFSSAPSISLVASASLDHTIRVFDLSSHLLQCVCTFDAGVVGVRFHVALPVMYGWSLDGTVRVWDPRSGAALKMLHGHSSHVLDCAISRSGDVVVSCSEDGSARVFNGVI